MDRNKIDAELERDYGNFKNFRGRRNKSRGKYNPQSWYIFGIQPPVGGIQKVVDRFIGQLGNTCRLASAGQIPAEMIIYGYPAQARPSEDMANRAKSVGNLCRGGANAANK